MTTLTTTLVDCPHCGRLTETDSAAHQEACLQWRKADALAAELADWQEHRKALEEQLRQYRRNTRERVEVRER